MAIRCCIVGLIGLLLSACANNPPPAPSKPTEWMRLDGTPAAGPTFQQAIAICNEQAVQAGNMGTTTHMQGMAMITTLNRCMSQRGFISH